ncbi:MAG TPA: hypothetical protein VK629_12005 [Steroidobacteraceae bacterium]|nr:hypothetical protein [Steroidobacteraceae bacterium]
MNDLAELLEDDGQPKLSPAELLLFYLDLPPGAKKFLEYLRDLALDRKRQPWH